MAQAMPPYLWSDQELVTFKELGPGADGNVPLKQHASLQATIGLRMIDQVFSPMFCFGLQRTIRLFIF